MCYATESGKQIQAAEGPVFRDRRTTSHCHRSFWYAEQGRGAVRLRDTTGEKTAHRRDLHAAISSSSSTYASPARCQKRGKWSALLACQSTLPGD